MFCQRNVITIVIILIISENWKLASSIKGNKYLEHIFYKYGNQRSITFEGLEHLMFNLGIGNIEFNPTHTLDEHRPNGFKIPDIDETQIDDDVAIINGQQNDERLRRVVLNRQNSETEDILWSNEMEKDTSFKKLHDPKHRHPRHHDHGMLATKSCLSPIALLRRVLNEQQLQQQHPTLHSNGDQGTLTNSPINSDTSYVVNHLQRRSVNINSNSDGDTSIGDENNSNDITSNITITPTMFMDLCPALLVQIEQGACAEVVRLEMGKLEKGFGVAWIYASISVLIISMCGIIGVAIVPLTRSMAYHQILRFLVALAVGTLCGDALMHLLPHALMPHSEETNSDASATKSVMDSNEHSNEPIWICSCAFFSALFMYTLENCLPLLRSDGHQHGHGHGHTHNTDHSHSHVVGHSHAVQPSDPSTSQRPIPNEETEIAMEVIRYVEEKELNKMIEDSNVSIQKKSLSPVAFMVILGDGLHNLTDGMAIGAAFAVDPVTGMATALAVLCHELPHELGDFALLIQSGVSIRKAMFFNIVSSILGIIGMVLGLVIVSVNTSFVRWIYAGTAGTFLYIALTDLVPEMARHGNGFKQVLSNVIGIFLGGILMLLIGLYEDKLKYLFE